MDAEVACASPSTDLCATDNGFTSRDDHRETDMQVLTDASLAVLGERYFHSEGILGGTGTGYATYTLDAPSQELRVRWYQRFHQYGHYYYNHFLGVTINGDGPCSRGATLEIGGQSGPYLYFAGSCGVSTGSDNIYPNQGAGTVPQIKNGKWYLFEVAIKMDTSCTNPGDWDGCNGVYKLWVDGELVMDYSNLNWGGTTDNAEIVDVQPWRNYRHKRNPYVPGEVYFDQIVIGTDADTEIGAASGATNIGTEVADIYALECGIEPFYIADYYGNDKSYSPELDHAGAGSNKITACGTAGSTWRGVAGTGDAVVYHTGIVTDTATGTPHDGISRPIAEQSFKASCTGANCGAGFLVPRGSGPVDGNEGDGNPNVYRNGTPPQWVFHGYIYFPSTSTPDDKIAYVGFVADGSTAYSDYVALSEDAGKWAIIQRHNDGAPTIVATSSLTIVRDTWHKFELVLWDTEGVSLMVNDVRLFDKQALPDSPTWLFDAANNSDHSGIVIGIVDYLGTGTVTVNYDDISIGSTSFWSSDGWGVDSPFASVLRKLRMFWDGVGSYTWKRL